MLLIQISLSGFINQEALLFFTDTDYIYIFCVVNMSNYLQEAEAKVWKGLYKSMPKTGKT